MLRSVLNSFVDKLFGICRVFSSSSNFIYVFSICAGECPFFKSISLQLIFSELIFHKCVPFKWNIFTHE